MKTSIYLFGLFSLVQVACGQNKEKKVPMFEWSATMSCPVGYPVDVINGDLSGHGFSSLELGTHYGPWGAQGRSWGGSEKGLPNKLFAFWISYAERQFYIIDTEVDYEKLLSYFSNGYTIRDANGLFRHRDYGYINVGFAPGGVVVLWVQGTLETVEIARYQGKKITLPERYGDDFDSHSRLVFDPDYWEDIMSNEKIVPIEVQEANKNKPIPYGLWDKYRNKFNWRIKFLGNSDTQFSDVRYNFFNGELKYQHVENEDYLKTWYNSLPFELDVFWKNSKKYDGNIFFDENEIFEAFEKLSNNNNEVEIVIIINVINDDTIIISLESNEMVIPLVKSKILIYETAKSF